MGTSQLYLPSLLPQWGIFGGVVLLTVGYVEKKGIWTRLGWSILIATGMTALYFNIFGGLNLLAEESSGESTASLLISTGWQTVAGGVLAVISLLMFQYKKKRYTILAILTLAYFVLTFFLYSQISGSAGKKIKTEQKSEQKL